MRDPEERWSERRIEIVIGNLLRAGVTIAAVLVAAGGLIYLMRHGGERVQYGAFHGEPDTYRSLHGVLGQVLSGRGRGLIQLGLLVLIATPVARVAFSAVAFAKQRDGVYVMVTLSVLVLLLYSLVVSQL